MSTRVLIGGVVGILLLAGGAYVMVSPTINNGGESDVINATATETDTAVSGPEAIESETDDDDRDISEREDNEVENVEDSIVTTKPVDAVVAPAPVVAPVVTTPTPVVQPEPAPVKTGYTLAEVAAHATKTSCWTTVNGSVYDITSYIPKHPGGERDIMKICGKDGSTLFDNQHGGESKPESRLASLYIGTLVK